MMWHQFSVTIETTADIVYYKVLWAKARIPAHLSKSDCTEIALSLPKLAFQLVTTHGWTSAAVLVIKCDSVQCVTDVAQYAIPPWSWQLPDPTLGTHTSKLPCLFSLGNSWARRARNPVGLRHSDRERFTRTAHVIRSENSRCYNKKATKGQCQVLFNLDACRQRFMMGHTQPYLVRRYLIIHLRDFQI